MNRLRRFFAGLTLLSVELIIVLVLFIVSLFGFIFITNNIFELKNTGFDNRVFNAIHPHINDISTNIMVMASFFGSHYFLLPANILLACYFLFFRKHPWNSITIPVVSLGSFLVMSSLKIFFSRPRPLNPVYEAARGFSYPSGHAMSALTFYGLLIYIIYENVSNQMMKWFLIGMLSLVIIVVGFSRVYLRVHYASDVLAGFSLGLIWLVISLWVIKRVGPRVGKRIEQRAENNK